MRHHMLLVLLLSNQLAGLVVAEHAGDAATREAIVFSESTAQWPAVDRGLSKQREATAQHTITGADGHNLQQSGNMAGRVVGWGIISIQNYIPSVVLQQGATDVAMLEGSFDGPDGLDIYLALLQNQSVVMWGGAGTVSIPDIGAANVTAIAVNTWEAAMLLSNGSVTAIDSLAETTAVPQVAQRGVDAIWGGGHWFFARLRNGSFAVWNGELNVNISHPASSSEQVVSVAAGNCLGVDDLSACWVSLRANGSVMPEGGVSVVPKVLHENVKAVAGANAQGSQSIFLALLSNGSIVQWRYATPDKLAYVLFPLNNTGMEFSSVATPFYAVTTSGAVVSWDPSNLTDTSSAVPLKAQNGIRSVVAGAVTNLVLALRDPGPYNVVAFNGEVIGPANDSIPAGISTPIVTQVAAGDSHAIALQNDGRVVVWGDGYYGQLAIPQDLASGGVKQVAAASSYCMAVTLQGGLYVWGDDSSLAIPREARFNVAKVAAGGTCVIALLTNGSIVVWGKADAGNLQAIPVEARANASDIVVNSGCDTAIAILNNGSIVQWGANSTTPQLENVVSAAVNSLWAGAVLKNGSLVIWPTSDNTAILPSKSELDFARGLHVQSLLLGDYLPPTDVATGSGRGIESDLTSLVLLTNYTVTTVPFACADCDIPPAAQSGVIDMAIGGSFYLAVTTSSTLSPAHIRPTSNATQSATVSFVYIILATHNLTTNSTRQHQFGQQLKAAMATYFNVSTASVAVNVSQSTAQQQAPLPTSRLLQASVPVQAQVTVPVNITAMWQSGDTTTPAFLQQQVSQLQQHPAVALPASLIQAYGIDAINVRINQLKTSNLPQAAVTLPPPSPEPVQIQTPPGQPASSPVITTSAVAPSSSKKTSRRVAAGITVGCVIAVALAAAAAVVVYRQYQRAPTSRGHITSPTGGGFEGVAIPTEAMKIAGLPEGELFVLATAQNYSWTEAAALSGPLQAIEAGVNDTQLDKMSQGPFAQQTAVGMYCPTVQLSKDELRQQVQLLSDGLLGRGATALVFKCVWPSRFGPDALLAAKVLHNGYESDVTVLSSFAYEAHLLAGIQHPHVVKLYGYCLDPPTVCLILELLPCSLKDVLYKAPPQAAGSQAASSTASKSNSLSRHNTSTPVSSAAQVPTAVTSMPTILPTAADTTKYVTAHTEVGAHSLDAAGSNDGDVCPYTLSKTADVSKYVTAQVDFTASCSAPSEATSSHTASNSTSTSHRLSIHGKQTATTPSSPVESSSNGPAMPPEAAADELPIDDTTESKFNNPLAVRSSVHPLKPVMLPQVVRMCTDIAAGLAYLHSQPAPATTVEGTGRSLPTSTTRDGRIVHRDLKPANILLNSQGVAKISDFGLARQHDHTTFATIHLGAGTLPYMAPELLISSKAGVSGAACTNRVDIYSLGIIMWELLMGQPPWKGMAAASIMAAVINRRRLPLPGDVQSEDREHAIMDMPLLQPLPAHSHPDLPKMCQIIQACWQHRELRRPTAVALHGTLSALLQQLEQQQ